MKKIRWVVFFLLSANIIWCQETTYSGYIEDAASGERLIGVNVYDNITEKGTTSNTFGFYSYTTEADSVLLLFSYVGYETQVLTLATKSNQSINIKLRSSSTLDEVVITDKKSKKIEERTQMSTIGIPIQQIKNVPALLGEVDVLKALQLLPGVQSGGEGQSGFYVRGGSPDQNLILLDGVPVYNASHLFGFFSVFNADAIKDVNLIKGGFPARFGGRLSSIVEINMKDGHNKEFHGTASVGLISSKFMLEGPLWSEKTSFVVAARRTYIDILARPLIKSAFESEGEEGITGYYFYDLNLKLNHKFSDKDKLFFSLYSGRDAFYLDIKDKESRFNQDYSENNFGWGNLTSALRWNHLWSPKLFSNTTMTFSRYNLDVLSATGSIESSTGYDDFISINYDSGIEDYSLGIDFDYVPNSSHFIRFGAKVIHHDFNPGNFDLEQRVDEDDFYFSVMIGQDEIQALESYAYIEDDYEITEKLRINGGLHFSAFNVNSKNYTSLQPRLGIRYLTDRRVSLKASFATMRQYINLLAFEGIGLPTDLWLPSTENIKPQDAWQAAVGAAVTLGGDIELSTEMYYKKMTNLVSYIEGEGIFAVNDWQERVTQGEGTSYGFELLLQKKVGRLNGWIGYTWSKTDRQFDDINGGEAFPFKYDRRHDISVVGNYKLSEKYSISGSWVYGTGNAITLSTGTIRNMYGDGKYNANNFEIDYYGPKNDYRMKSYHRFDIGVSRVKRKKHGVRTLSFGAYNVYNRKNPFFIFRDFEGSRNREVFKQASLFPIIPYINYKYEF